VAGRFAFKERLSFTLERGSLKVLLEELQEDRLSLKIIIKGLKTQQEHVTREPSRDAIKMVRRLTQVQALAASLFSALSRCSACTCRTKHSVMAKLESRIPTQGTWQKRGQRLEATVFDIVLPLEDFVFQQASVNAMVADENMSLAWYVIRLPQMLLIYLLTISTTAKAALSHHNCLHYHLDRERNTTD
jgi:hypothetical protein